MAVRRGASRDGRGEALALCPLMSGLGRLGLGSATRCDDAPASALPPAPPRPAQCTGPRVVLPATEGDTFGRSDLHASPSELAASGCQCRGTTVQPLRP